MTTFKQVFNQMSAEQKKSVLGMLIKTVEPQECYALCKCGVECTERLFITKYEEYSIMECLECGAIQVVYRQQWEV